MELVVCFSIRGLRAESSYQLLFYDPTIDGTNSVTTTGGGMKIINADPVLIQHDSGYQFRVLNREDGGYYEVSLNECKT